MISLLASGRPGSSLLPPRQTQWSVCSSSSWVLRLRLLLRCWLCLCVRFDRRSGSGRWSGRPLCMLPVCLAGCLWLSGSWSVSYLLASDWRSRFRVLFVLLSPSLSLCSSLVRPSRLWGAVPCWLQCLSLVPSTLVLRVVIFLVGCLFVSHRFLRGWLPVVALSRLRGGAQLFCFPVVPSQSVLPALSGEVGGLPGSLLCLPPGYGSFSRFPVVWFGASAPFHAGPTPGLSSAPWLFHRFLPRVSSVWPLLDSSLLCYLASWLVLGSSFQFLLKPDLPPNRHSLFGLMVLP